MCDSFECLKETFENFIILYNLCNELDLEISYKSRRLYIEQTDCLKESKKITEEIERIKENERLKQIQSNKHLENIYLKKNMKAIYVPQRKVRYPFEKHLTTPETPTRRPIHKPSRSRALRTRGRDG